MATTLLILNGFTNFFSLLEREVNFQQNPYNTSHYTFSMLPHYLAKLKNSSFGISGRKCKRKCNIHWLIWLTYLLFQFPVPAKYS